MVDGPAPVVQVMLAVSVPPVGDVIWPSPLNTAVVVVAEVPSSGLMVTVQVLGAPLVSGVKVTATFLALN